MQSAPNGEEVLFDHRNDHRRKHSGKYHEDENAQQKSVLSKSHLKIPKGDKTKFTAFLSLKSMKLRICYRCFFFDFQVNGIGVHCLAECFVFYKGFKVNGVTCATAER